MINQSFKHSLLNIYDEGLKLGIINNLINHHMNNENQSYQDPKVILQSAIEELDVFTQLETSHLEIGENGRLVATKKSPLERVVGLARCYIAPLFSEQIRKEQQRKLLEVKKAILRARDIVKSHSPLIERYKAGDETQRKLAESALLTIERYNAIVNQGNSSAKNEAYDFEQQLLLLDKEIKGQQIEMPYVISVKYNSHPHSHPAHETIKELSRTFDLGAVNKNKTPPITTHKKTLQFMIDTFQMKANRLIESHLQKPISEIVPLIKQRKPEIDEREEIIHMKQRIEIHAGAVILVTGSFNPKITTMPMPILDSFRLSFQFTHSGYPYAFQHTGWVLGDHWVEAAPLRENQTPYFHQVDQRRKRLAQRLLFDQAYSEKVEKHFKIKKDVFDQNRHIFLPLHCQLLQALLKEASSEDTNPLIDSFYQEAASAPSPFEFLARTQQQVLECFVHQPFKALENEWLEGLATPLRTGTPQERYRSAKLILDQFLESVQTQFDPANIREAYILQQGLILNEAFQKVTLQYQSEKMEFSPPPLSDFHRKLQMCAFQQLLTFLDECEHRIEVLDPAQIKSELLVALTKDLQVIESSQEDEHSLPVIIVNEIEHYFDGRFHLNLPKNFKN